MHAKNHFFDTLRINHHTEFGILTNADAMVVVPFVPPLLHDASICLGGTSVRPLISLPKTDPEKKELRARQNVIFELGFFVGKVGRHKAFALVEKGVALPSDIHGLIYIPLDPGNAWRLLLVRELNAAGIWVDANLAL
jgi:hypothetical protein